MKFAFIAKHKRVWPLSWLCSALGVSRSGFHAWLTRKPREAVFLGRPELEGTLPVLLGSMATSRYSSAPNPYSALCRAATSAAPASRKASSAVSTSSSPTWASTRIAPARWPSTGSPRR